MDKQQVLMYSTGNYIQYSVINHDKKNIKYVCIYIYIFLKLESLESIYSDSFRAWLYVDPTLLKLVFQNANELSWYHILLW